MTAPPAPRAVGLVRRSVALVQGEHRVSRDPDEVLTTVLGSCVATCLYDPQRRVGGMNHFLLPDGGDGAGDRTRYGLHAMELLINALLRAGARRGALVAKLFGGARMRDGFGGIGVANAEFARRFLAEEGIPLITSSLGGDRARRLRFWPTTGHAQQMLLDRSRTVAVAAPRPTTEDVVFF